MDQSRWYMLRIESLCAPHVVWLIVFIMFSLCTHFLFRFSMCGVYVSFSRMLLLRTLLYPYMKFLCCWFWVLDSYGIFSVYNNVVLVFLFLRIWILFLVTILLVSLQFPVDFPLWCLCFCLYYISAGRQRREMLGIIWYFFWYFVYGIKEKRYT